MRTYLALGLLIAPSAAAQSCPAISETDFRNLVFQAQSAVDRGDLSLHQSIIAETLLAVPCFNFAPSPHLWADFLMSKAIGDFSMQRSWRPWLSAALRVNPRVDRGVGSAHPLYSWTPEPSLVVPNVSAISFDLFVDGLQSEQMPPSAGVYLIQRRDGPWWKSLLVFDSRVPISWINEPAHGPKRRYLFGSVGVFTQVSQTLQISDTPNDWTDANLIQPILGANLHLWTLGPTGLGGAMKLESNSTTSQNLRIDARISLITELVHGYLGAGVGIIPVTLNEGLTSFTPPEPRTLNRPLPHITLQQHDLFKHHWDTRATLHYRPNLARLDLFANRDVASGAFTGLKFRAGGGLRVTTAQLNQGVGSETLTRYHLIEARLHLSTRIGSPY